jgi:hypothetical protein
MSSKAPFAMSSAPITDCSASALCGGSIRATT